MITFNIQARNGNYYRGHEPSNKSSNCWIDTVDDAMTFTIDQAREIVKAWKWNHLNIVIALSSEPISPDLFHRELFCARGGDWYDYPKQKEKNQ